MRGKVPNGECFIVTQFRAPVVPLEINPQREDLKFFRRQIEVAADVVAIEIAVNQKPVKIPGLFGHQLDDRLTVCRGQTVQENVITL